MKRLISIVLLCSVMACTSEDSGPAQLSGKEPVTDWRLQIQLPDVELPAQLHLSDDGSEAWVTNGSEKVYIDEVSRQGENWRLHFPAFNNTLELREKDDSLEGTLTLVKRGYEQLMQVTGEPDRGFRFKSDPKASSDFTGRWQVLAGQARYRFRYPGCGYFRQNHGIGNIAHAQSCVGISHHDFYRSQG